MRPRQPDKLTEESLKPKGSRHTATSRKGRGQSSEIRVPSDAFDNVKLLKAEQVAELLSVHVRSVWRQASVGELPSPIRIGGATRWRLAEILDYIERQSQSGGQR